MKEGLGKKNVKETLLLMLTISLISTSIFPSARGELETKYTVRVNVPAVIARTIGRITKIKVTVFWPGKGEIMINSDAKVRISINASAYTAFEVARFITRKDVSLYDFEINISSEAQSISGGSGGAGLAVSFIACLLKIPVRQDTAITGAINPDGSIGWVSGLEAKASAVADAGLKFLVIPALNAKEARKNPLTGREETVNISNEIEKRYGIKILKARDIWDAFLFLTGYEISKPMPKLRGVNSSEFVTPITMFLRENSLKMYNDSLNSFKSLYSLYNETIEYEEDNHALKYIGKEIKDLRVDIAKIKQQIEEGRLYTALSLSFQVIVKTEYLKLTINYYATRDKGKFLKSVVQEKNLLISKTWNYLNTKKTRIKNFGVLHTASGQASSTAYQRIIDAEIAYKKALKKKEVRSLNETLYDLAYAGERAKTAEWWMNFASSLENKEAPIYTSGKTFKEYLERNERYSKLMLSFIEDLVIELEAEKAVSPEIAEKIKEETERRSESIRIAMNKSLYSTALLQIIETVSWTNYVTVTTYTPFLSDADFRSVVLKNLDKETLLWTELAIENGINPLLSIFYYEFGKNYLESNPSTAFQMLFQARSISSEMLKMKVITGEPVNFPEIKPVKVEIERKSLSNATQKTLEALIALTVFSVIMITGYIVKRKSRKNLAVERKDELEYIKGGR